MLEAANEVVIARPIDAVYGFLSNTENDGQWRPGVIEIKRTSGSGVGATYRQVVKGPGGRPISADIEITDLRPNELISFRATSGPVRPRGRYQLAPAEDGTRIRFELEAELHGLKRMMAPMVRKTMQNEVGALSNLKRVLERDDQR
jgi:uncharacterized membrane protein